MAVSSTWFWSSRPGGVLAGDNSVQTPAWNDHVSFVYSVVGPPPSFPPNRSTVPVAESYDIDPQNARGGVVPLVTFVQVPAW